MKRFALVATAALALTMTATADMKLKTRMTVQGFSMESTKMVKGARERTEMNMGPMSMVTIYQCDQQRLLTLNDQARTYTVTRLSDVGSAGAADAKAAGGATRKGGTLTITMNSTDTGERKQMFGHTAKHIKTEMSTQASPNSCAGREGNNKISMDGWYIDVPNIACTNAPQMNRPGRGQSECHDDIRFAGNGMKMLGYPVVVDMTIQSPQGPMAMRQEVTDLSAATLDASLFDPPAGYRESGGDGMPVMPKAVAPAARPEEREQALGSMGPPRRAGSFARESSGGAGTSRASGGGGSSYAASGAGASSAPGDGGSGRLRIGLVTFGSASGQATSLGAMREKLIEQLEALGPEAVGLEVPASSSPVAVEKAAREAGCQYFVYNVISSFKAPGGKKKLGGFLARATGVDSNASVGDYEIGLQYRLFYVGEADPKLESAAESKQGATAEESAATATEAEAGAIMVQVKKDEIRRRLKK